MDLAARVALAHPDPDSRARAAIHLLSDISNLCSIDLGLFAALVKAEPELLDLADLACSILEERMGGKLADEAEAWLNVTPRTGVHRIKPPHGRKIP